MKKTTKTVEDLTTRDFVRDFVKRYVDKSIAKSVRVSVWDSTRVSFLPIFDSSSPVGNFICSFTWRTINE